ncbi:MAG: argininosuccinate synthase [Bacteroidota bacterium]
MSKEKVLLALSGGLDTSFCAVYLAKEKNMEVHSAVVNTGGFSAEEADQIEKQAKRLGVVSHSMIDVSDEYYTSCLRYLIYGNVLRNRNYPLSVSSERTFQAIALAQYAAGMGINKIAHGSTGAGNDQVRFDLVFQVLTPGVEVLTPIRDLGLTRQQEIDYLAKEGIQMDARKGTYSINQGLWGTSVGGKETLTSDQELPQEAYPSEVTRTGSEMISIGFEKGEPVSLNGKTLQPVELIRALNELGSPWGIGRDVHVGDTIIGIKGRVGFEAPAAHLLIDAHLALEKHVLTRWQMHWKEQIGNWYGMFVHEAQFLEPVMRDLEKFLSSTQQQVSGEVFIRLRPYSHNVTGVKSPHDLMNPEFAAYGEKNLAWTAEDVKGFTKILGNQQHIWYRVNNKEFNQDNSGKK